jgi:hypothetical protein
VGILIQELLERHLPPPLAEGSPKEEQPAMPEITEAGKVARPG